MQKAPAPFTKAEVDYLVKEPKFIKEVPAPTDFGTYWRIQAQVYRKSDNSPVKGLLVIAKVEKPLPGLSNKGRVSAALEWKGKRIRGIDKEQRHDNPDGSVVYGWHDHHYSPQYLDSLVVPCPEPQHKDLRGLIEFAMARWNIEIQKEQLRLE